MTSLCMQDKRLIDARYYNSELAASNAAVAEWTKRKGAGAARSLSAPDDHLSELQVRACQPAMCAAAAMQQSHQA